MLKAWSSPPVVTCPPVADVAALARMARTPAADSPNVIEPPLASSIRPMLAKRLPLLASLKVNSALKKIA
ncbi:MAG: hypothetical protein GEV05_06755 [Betaproteobacteria bacterium]|nr:hypothetical protein [Betaproteobacteria bacterium]